MLTRFGRVGLFIAGIGAVALVVVLLAAGVVLASKRPATVAGRDVRSAAAALGAASASATSVSGAAFADVAPDATLTLAQRAAVPPGQVTTTALDPAVAAPRPVVKPKKVPPAVSPVEAYRGLGSWVDLFDDKAWNDPAAAVRDMASHGVRTLYLETSNSRSTAALKDAGAIETFIREAHARKMRVVAWYLPDLQDVPMDFDRVSAAIRFRTSDGQAFDSFALDIESTVNGDEAARNAALQDLSQRIRALTGKRYPLGAITPSPVGIATNASYWVHFPYQMLAGIYDVFVPMSYYTYHGSGGPAALQDTLSNVRILRGQPGCADKPIHLIGGISNSSSDSEVRAFVQAAVASKVLGASLYGWVGTTPAMWTELAAVKR